MSNADTKFDVESFLLPHKEAKPMRTGYTVLHAACACPGKLGFRVLETIFSEDRPRVQETMKSLVNKKDMDESTPMHKLDGFVESYKLLMDHGAQTVQDKDGNLNMPPDVMLKFLNNQIIDNPRKEHLVVDLSFFSGEPDRSTCFGFKNSVNRKVNYDLLQDLIEDNGFNEVLMHPVMDCFLETEMHSITVWNRKLYLVNAAFVFGFYFFLNLKYETIFPPQESGHGNTNAMVEGLSSFQSLKAKLFLVAWTALFIMLVGVGLFTWKDICNPMYWHKHWRRPILALFWLLLFSSLIMLVWSPLIFGSGAILSVQILIGLYG